MKGVLVLLGRYAGREAAARLVDGRLQDVSVAPPEGAPPAIGAILRGKLGRPAKGLGGAFVTLPGGISGFLRRTSGLRPGQAVIVQVAGHAEPGKALPVTTRIRFKGRDAIVTPGKPGLNISRAITATDERARLAALAEAAMAGAPEDMGLIVRSAAVEATDTEIAGEIAALSRQAEAICADGAGAPEVLLDAPGPHAIARRDWILPAPDAVEDSADAFATHGVEEMMAELLAPQVALADGAGMVIEPTRALVAIDVNTGAEMSPAAGLKANLAAARELPRQLRLRGLGGQIVVDFAPMSKRDRQVLEQSLRAAFRREADAPTLAGWTPLGLFEMQRARKVPLSEQMSFARGAT